MGDMSGKIVYENESFLITGAIFEVYRTMGSGFLEDVYQDCLRREFILRNIPFVEKPSLDIYYKEEKIEHHYIPDFVCFGNIILEIKAASNLVDEHYGQLKNYLAATGFKRGLLVNFHEQPKVHVRRMVL